MNLIIIAGPSSTGKSTLANRLAKDLKIPAFLRDEYKEKRFDELGRVPNLREYARIDAESKTQLFAELSKANKEDSDLIIESNFLYSERPKLQKFIPKNTNIIEIFCHANGLTILRRYTQRWKSGDRHRGHRDYLWRPIVAIESLGLVKIRYRPLKLSELTQKIDTNDFSRVDYKAIYKYITDRLT